MRRVVVLLSLFVAFNTTAQELPYTAFGTLPVIEQPRVSPDGAHVAAILNGPDGPTVVVSDFGSTDLNAIVRLENDESRLDWIRWANDERILISVSESSGLGAKRYRVPRLYQVGLDGKDMKQVRRKVTGKEYQRQVEWMKNMPTNKIISILPDEPDHILMQLWDEWDEAYAVYKVEFAKNKFKKQFPNSYNVSEWTADSKGNVIYGWEHDVYSKEYVYWYRPLGEKKWRKLDSRKFAETTSFWPAGIEGDEAIVFSDREFGRVAVWRYDIATGEYRDLLFAVDGHDIAGTITSNDQSKILGVYYYDHFRVDHYFDSDAEQKAKLVASSFPEHAVSIVSRSLDQNRMMVSLYKDNEPQKYVWVDLAQKAASSWFSQYPDLQGVAMPNVQPIEFEARDGRKITGYLTMPLQWDGEKPSLIVHPHGGPSSRDLQYFDSLVQFFANRGHAVLQVNFRGSSGFGTEFNQAGWRQWGQAMQEDVYDAVAWVENQGLIDKDRKCVVGAGGYGGYVALVAAYQKPHDYRCIVSIAGISDLNAQMKTLSVYRDPKQFIGTVVGTPYDSDDKQVLHEDAATGSSDFYVQARRHSIYRARKQVIGTEVGNPSNSDDIEMMENNSAVGHIVETRAPHLVVHGSQDSQVRIQQARHFYDMATREKIDIEYLELEDGTHYLDEYNNRLAVFKALDEFLDANL